MFTEGPSAVEYVVRGGYSCLLEPNAGYIYDLWSLVYWSLLFIFTHLYDLSSPRSSWYHELISALTVKTQRLCFPSFSISPSSVLSPLCLFSLSLSPSCADPSQQSCQPGAFECVYALACVCACLCVRVCVCVCVCVLMKLTNPLLLLHPLKTRPDKQMKYACSAICFIFSWQWPSAGAPTEKCIFRLTNSAQCVAACFSYGTMHNLWFAFIPS